MTSKTVSGGAAIRSVSGPGGRVWRPDPEIERKRASHQQ
jgi:hypothetical protein